MKLTLIGTIITFFGFILVSASILIIFLGKKVGGDSRQPQRIKIGKLIEARTNSVLTLVLICAIFTISPLLLAYWKPDLNNYIHMDDIEKQYMAYEDLSLSINGQAFERKKVIEDGKEIETDFPANNVDVILERKIGDRWDEIETETTDNQGSFSFSLPPPPVRLNEKYRISWKKGNESGKETFRYSWKNYEIHLKQTGRF